MFRDIVTAITAALAIVVLGLAGATMAHTATAPVAAQVATTTAPVKPADDAPADVISPRVAAILVTAGDYEPRRADDVLTGAQWEAMLDVYAAGENGATGCTDWARTLMIGGDYVPAMAPCLGDEDSRAVSVLLHLGGR